MPLPPACSVRSARPRGPGWLFAGVALAAALIGFGRLLPAYFTGDDFAFVGRYATFPFSEWPGLFTRTWQAGLFSVDLREIRPLNALAFMVDARLWGAQAFGFRLTNLLLHAGCAALVGLMVWEFTQVRRVALLALALFAFHPVTVPAVGWISGRVDVLSTFFLLGAACAWLRFRRSGEAGGGALAVLGLGFAAALFTKESALVFPGLMLLFDLALGGVAASWRRARTWWPYLVMAATLASYCVCRQIAFGLAGPAGVGRGVPVFSDAVFWLELLQRQASYVGHLFPPAADWLRGWRDEGFALRGADFVGVLVISGAGAVAALAGWRWLRRDASSAGRRQILLAGGGWCLLTTVPLILTYFSERHLYLTTAGFAFAIALMAHELLPSPRRWAIAVAIVLLAAVTLQQRALTSWLQAAATSRAFAEAIQKVAREAAPGTIVFIDAPPMIDGAFCWSWAVPHALRPPFAPEALDGRMVPVAFPGAFAYREEWRERLPWTAFEQAAHDAHLLSLGRGRILDRVIPAEQVRGVAALAGLPRLAENDDWQRLLAALLRQDGSLR